MTSFYQNNSALGGKLDPLEAEIRASPGNAV